MPAKNSLNNEPGSGNLSRTYVPGGLLSNFINVIWYWQEVDLLKGKECVIPTGTIELVIDLNSKNKTDAIVTGVITRPHKISVSGHNGELNRLLGINFKPAGLYPFIPVPVNELTNESINLADLWGKQEAEILLSNLDNALAISGKIRILEKWLLSRLQNRFRYRPEVNMAMHEILRNPNISISKLSETANLSHKSFNQVFSRITGITPKLFSRIQRFQQGLDIIDFRAEVDWLDLVLTCGYFDQSHFVHEFREFCGINPSTYLDIRSDHRNHIPAMN